MLPSLTMLQGSATAESHRRAARVQHDTSGWRVAAHHGCRPGWPPVRLGLEPGVQTLQSQSGESPPMVQIVMMWVSARAPVTGQPLSRPRKACQPPEPLLSCRWQQRQHADAVRVEHSHAPMPDQAMPDLLSMNYHAPAVAQQPLIWTWSIPNITQTGPVHPCWSSYQS